MDRKRLADACVQVRADYIAQLAGAMAPLLNPLARLAIEYADTFNDQLYDKLDRLTNYTKVEDRFIQMIIAHEREMPKMLMTIWADGQQAGRLSAADLYDIICRDNFATWLHTARQLMAYDDFKHNTLEIGSAVMLMVFEAAAQMADTLADALAE